MIRLIVFVVFFSVCHGHSIPSNGRIVGGQETTIEKYPAIVQVERRSDNVWSQFCAGNILTTRYILSAAHCFEYATDVNRRVRAGATTRNSGGVVIEAQVFILHPNFDSWTLNNDICLVYLVSPLTYSSSIQPTTILAQGSVVPDDAIVTHAGWGSLTDGGPSAEVIHEVDIYKINNQVCQLSYNTHPLNSYYNFIITEGMICAGIFEVGGKDACSGDYGGPLYYFGNQYLIGVVSWGSESVCADPIYPGVSANVAHYTNWILQSAI